MNKYEIISFPVQNNGDDFTRFTLTDLSAVEYSSELSLAPGEVTFDDNDKAFWIKPTTYLVEAVPYRRGYLKDTKSYFVSDGDDIEVEYEIMSAAEFPPEQKAGVTLDLRDVNNLVVGSLYFTVYPMPEAINEYRIYKFKQRISLQYPTVDKVQCIIGTVSSPDSATYEYKIRYIKVTIIRNSANDYTPA